jgi:hypothetical protein
MQSWMMSLLFSHHLKRMQKNQVQHSMMIMIMTMTMKIWLTEKCPMMFIAQPKPSQKDVEFAVLVLLASILADIFHEMHKVCKTISEQHSLHKQFTRAFSDTMLVPDKHDKAQMMSYLKAKGLTWDKVHLSSPGWLWKRVWRYIPEKNFLCQILTEFFNCWGPVKL